MESVPALTEGIPAQHATKTVTMANELIVVRSSVRKCVRVFVTNSFVTVSVSAKLSLDVSTIVECTQYVGVLRDSGGGTAGE